MRILYHHRTLGDGAEGIHIAEMVNAFRKLGHEVQVVSPIGGQTNVVNKHVNRMAQLKRIVPSVAYEFMELTYNLFGYQILKKAVREFHPDFIYDRYITFNASSILAGKHFKLPVILEVNAPLALERQNESDEKLYLNNIAHRLERWICANADKTIVVSSPLKDYLVSIGVNGDKIAVLPNGVNLDTFKPEEKDKSIIDRLGIPDHRLIIGFVGILRPWHGLDILIDAFAKLKGDIENVHLLLIGDGPIRTSIEDKINRLNIARDVTITGRIEHSCISRYANVIDIAVSPMATFYASPMKILEYMALRKPVIAPDTDNIRDIIVDGIDGLLFAAGNVSALSSAMGRLVRDRDLQVSMAVNARRKVEMERNWLENAKKVLCMVQELQK